MKSTFISRRFQHLLDQAAPEVVAAVAGDIERFGWQPDVAARSFRALQPLAIAGSLDRHSLVEIAGHVAKNERGRDLKDVLSATFGFPKKNFDDLDRALDALADDGYLDALCDILASSDPTTLDKVAALFIHPSISSFNKVWEPLMRSVLTTALAGVATVTSDKAASLRAVADAKARGITIDATDAIISRQSLVVAHSELKGTSEKNQGDSATDRVIRESQEFRRVPAFHGLRYVAFISGDGFHNREVFKRFDAAADPRFVLCTTDAEAPIFRGLGSRTVLSLTELAAVVATW